MEGEQPAARPGESAQTRIRQALQRLGTLAAKAPPRKVPNVNDLFQEELTWGDHVAIAVASWMGSWAFIIAQSVFLAAWTVLNIVGWIKHWDPYPFILMALLLSLEGAYTAPLIMMAQNRDAAKDRLMLQEDCETNRRAAAEIERIVEILEQQGHLLELLLEERWQHSKDRSSNDDSSNDCRRPDTVA